ncbi:MAG: Ig-like domain-containing protein [Bacteroides sp.]|nr:Ig-like domain-containing protein [Bacteroides sp.]
MEYRFCWFPLNRLNFLIIISFPTQSFSGFYIYNIEHKTYNSMKTKALWGLWLLLFTLGAVACSDDDIYFTQDEIVEGDIMTGKQVRLVDNTLVVYTGMSGSVNIQGGKGDCTAKSANTEVATVTESNDGGSHMVLVTGNAIGNTIITVTDSKGNSSSFAVIVKNAEDLWGNVFIYEYDEEFGQKECFVRGASPADSAAIVADVFAKNKDCRFVMKSRFAAPSEIYRTVVYDAEGKVLLDGPSPSPVTVDKDVPSFKWEVYSRQERTVLARYLFVQNSGPRIIKGLTEEYQAKYPEVSSVALWIPVRKLREGVNE